MPQYGIESMVGRRSGDMKSSIVKHVIFVKIRKSPPKREYAPVGIERMTGQKSGDIKPSIIEHVT